MIVGDANAATSLTTATSHEPAAYPGESHAVLAELGCRFRRSQRALLAAAPVLGVSQQTCD